MLCIATIWLHILANVLDPQASANLQKTKPITSVTNKMPFVSAENERSSKKEYAHIKPFPTLHSEESFSNLKDTFSGEQPKMDSKARITARVDRKPDKNYVMTLNLDLDMFNTGTPEDDFFFNLGPTSPKTAFHLQSTLEKPSRPQYQDRTIQSEKMSILPSGGTMTKEQRGLCNEVGSPSKSFSEGQGGTAATSKCITEGDIEMSSNRSAAEWQDTEYKDRSQNADKRADISFYKTISEAVQQHSNISSMNQTVYPEMDLTSGESGEPSNILSRSDERHSTGNAFYDAQNIGNEVPEKDQGEIHHPSKTLANMEEFPVTIEVPAKDHMESRIAFESAEMKHLQRPIVSYVKEIDGTYPKRIELTDKIKLTEETMLHLEPPISGNLKANILESSEIQQVQYSPKEINIESLDVEFNQTGPAKQSQFTRPTLPQLSDRDTLDSINNQSHLPGQHGQIVTKDMYELHSEQSDVNLVRTPQPRSSTLGEYQGQEQEKEKLEMASLSKDPGTECVRPEKCLGYSIKIDPLTSYSKANFPEQMSMCYKESSITQQEDSSNLIPAAAFSRHTDEFGHAMYEKLIGRNQDTTEVPFKKDNDLTEQSQGKGKMLQTEETRDFQANVRLPWKGHDKSADTDSRLLKDAERPKFSSNKELDVQTSIDNDPSTKSTETLNEPCSLRDPQTLKTVTDWMSFTERENIPTILSRSSDKSSSHIANKQFNVLDNERSEIFKEKGNSQELREVVLQAQDKKTAEGRSRESVVDLQKVKNLPDERQQIKSVDLIPPENTTEVQMRKTFSQKGSKESMCPTNLEIIDVERSVSVIKDNDLSKRSDVSEDKSISLARQRQLIQLKKKDPVSPSQGYMTPGSTNIPLEEKELGFREKSPTTQDGISAAKHDVSPKFYELKHKEAILVGPLDSQDKIKEEKPYSKIEPTIQYVPKLHVDQPSKYRLQKTTLSSQDLIPSEMDSDSLKKFYHEGIPLPIEESTKKELEHRHFPPDVVKRLEDTSATKISAALEKHKKIMKTSQHEEETREEGKRQLLSMEYLIGIKMLSTWTVFLFGTLLEHFHLFSNSSHLDTMIFLLRAPNKIIHSSFVHLLIVTCTHNIFHSPLLS